MPSFLLIGGRPTTVWGAPPAWCSPINRPDALKTGEPDEPGSVSVVRYTPLRPFVLRMNDTSGELTPFLPPPPQPRAADDDDASGAAGSDAVVGGPAGPPTGTGAEKP